MKKHKVFFVLVILMFSFCLKANNEENYNKIKKEAIDQAKNGNIDIGINILQNAIHKFKDKKKKIKLIIAELYFYEANKLEMNKEYKNSLEYLQRSLAIREVYDIDKASFTLLSIASIYVKSQDFENAKEYYHKALYLNKKNKNIANYMWIYMKMGDM